MKIECPQCGWSKDVPEGMTGRAGKCPECGQTIHISGPENSKKELASNRLWLILFLTVTPTAMCLSVFATYILRPPTPAKLKAWAKAAEKRAAKYRDQLKEAEDSIEEYKTEIARLKANEHESDKGKEQNTTPETDFLSGNSHNEGGNRSKPALTQKERVARDQLLYNKFQKRREQKIQSIKQRFPALPVPRWDGRKFIFLPKSKKLQEYGYSELDNENGPSRHPIYKECVGKIATVELLEDGPEYKVAFHMRDGTGYTWSGHNEDPGIGGIALLRDIKLARNNWVGETLWLKNHRDSNCIPVRVTEIRPSHYSGSPMSFLLKTPSGDTISVDCQLSSTNDFKSSMSFFMAEYFYFVDPRGHFPWAEDVWKLIREGKIRIGMTRSQVRFSWGDPEDINTTTTANEVKEQWVYGAGNYVYFEDGILSAIQN
jgi:hypothetical protein